MGFSGSVGLKKIGFSAKFGSAGSTTTSGAYVTIVDSDILIDPDIFKYGGKLWLRFIAHFYNSEANTTYMRIYRQNAASVVPNTELSHAFAGVGWTKEDTGWMDFSSETGLESYQVQMKVTGGTGMYNSAIMLLASRA